MRRALLAAGCLLSLSSFAADLPTNPNILAIVQDIDAWVTSIQTLQTTVQGISSIQTASANHRRRNCGGYDE